MTQHTQGHRRLTHGGTVARVLLCILGFILALNGLLFLLAGCLIATEGDGAGFPLAIFSICLLAGGILLVIGQLKGGTSSSGGGSGAPKAGSSEEVISVTPISGPADPANPTPPAAAAEVTEAPAAEASSTEEVARVVFRSTDVFATLRDLVRHEDKAGSDKRHLATMLAAAGVMDWRDAPACEGGRLSRTNNFWFRLNIDDLTNDQYDTLLAAEAALGINQDLPELRELPLDSAQVTDATLDLMRKMCDQKLDHPDLTALGARLVYGGEDTAPKDSEWIVRSLVCNAAECVHVPFRVVYDLRSNVGDGIVLLGVEIVRPRCMAIFTPDPARQVALARAYALRLCTLLARHAFEASEAVQTVVVNAHEHDSEQTLLSVKLDRAKLEALLRACNGTMIEQGFPNDDAIRAHFEGSWFAPVEPFMTLDSHECTSELARKLPELDTREASEAMRRTCHIDRVCELGINENAGRVAAWNEVRKSLGDTTEQAVAALVALRGEARDITVVEACSRTAEALVEGSLDLDSLDAMGELFVNGSALDKATISSNALVDDSMETCDPEAAIKVLEAALAPIDDMGIYLDDESTVYRYFGSVPERIVYNRTVNEGGREVHLVPDAYFSAHANASIAYGMLERYEEAHAHADVCMRLAPVSTYATMRKVRILEAQSRIYEAADLIVNALDTATTPHDAAICHYRLAYMEWKLGREDLAAACYTRALTWDTEVTQQARMELDDLVENIPSLQKPSSEQADALLAREGIPLGCVRTDGEHLLAAAVACMDHEALITARPLTAALFRINGDDVMMGIYRSLSVSS